MNCCREAGRTIGEPSGWIIREISADFGDLATFRLA